MEAGATQILQWCPRGQRQFNSVIIITSVLGGCRRGECSSVGRVVGEGFSDNVKLDINGIDRAAGGAQSRFVDKWSDNSCGFENCGPCFDYVAARRQLHHLP